MRLGGPVVDDDSTPESWIRAVVDAGYGAAFCPVAPDADEATVRAYADAAIAADVVIAEVAAWSNPIDRDASAARAAIELSQQRLDLAERIGARCCINISGTRGEPPYGPSADNLTDDTFALVVDTVREIVDAVRPTTTCYTLEVLPWAFPDSPDSYLRLIRAVDRPAFAVSLDPVNLMSGTERFFANGALIDECFRKLGPYIRSCHAKDVALSGELLVHLTEVEPGAGQLDYGAFLRGLAGLDRDVPLMIEHLDSPAAYVRAADHVRGVARDEGLEFVAPAPK